MQLSSDILLGSAIGLLAALLWAMSTNVYKSQSDKATPLAIATLKMLMSLIVMALLVVSPFRTNPFFMPVEAIGFLASSVIIGLVVGDIAFLTAQERIGVSYSYPIATTYPIFTYVIAILVVNEIVLWSRFIGIFLAVIGVMLITHAQASSSNDEGESNFDKIGILLSLFTAICWSVGSVLLQIGVLNVDPVDANFIRMIFGWCVIAPVYLGSVGQGMHQPSRRATMIILVAAIFGMAWGSLLYTQAVKLIGATVASVLGSVSPLFALPISILLLKEKSSHWSIIGALLTVTGVILVVLIV